MAPWGQGYESQRANLTSLLGTLAQKKEGKKNRQSALLRDILGIGAQFGGAALQNQWAKKATAQEQQFKSIQDTIAAARGKTEGEEGYARELAAGDIGFQRDKELEQMRIDAGAYSRGGGGSEQEDASKLIPYDIASQAWDAWWERLQGANPKRQMSAKDFDQFRTVAVEAGAKYGFAREQMEDAVNTLAQSYGFDVIPAGGVGGGGGVSPYPLGAELETKYAKTILPAIQNLQNLREKYSGKLPEKLQNAADLIENDKWRVSPKSSVLAAIKTITSAVDELKLASTLKTKDPLAQKLFDELQTAGFGGWGASSNVPPEIPRYKGPPTGSSRWGK